MREQVNIWHMIPKLEYDQKAYQEIGPRAKRFRILMNPHDRRLSVYWYVNTAARVFRTVPRTVNTITPPFEHIKCSCIRRKRSFFTGVHRTRSSTAVRCCSAAVSWFLDCSGARVGLTCETAWDLVAQRSHEEGLWQGAGQAAEDFTAFTDYR